jgi:hypothetical protein
MQRMPFVPALQRFAAILLADLRERSRSTRFWVVLGLVGIVTWWCFPPLDAGYVTVGIGENARGRYSSAWVGMVLGLMYSTMLSLFGFYLVRGTVVRDFDTRVWQLLVATTMTRRGYLLAKWASHLAVFSLIMLLGLVVGLAAQWFRGEVRSLHLFELVKPVFIIGLPALAVTAFFAVLFDLLPWLRRTGGNVLYFFTWIFLFIAAFSFMDPEKVAWARTTWLSDPTGVALAVRDMQAQLAVTAPGLKTDGLNIGMSIMDSKTTVFDWNQWSPRPMDMLGRLLWLLLPMAAVALLAPLLDWAAARTRGAASSTARPGNRLRLLDPLLRPLEGSATGTLLAAELKLVLRQRSHWWWLALGVLALMQFNLPMEGAGIAALGAWLASIDVFSRAILRERESGTGVLVFVASGVSRRLLAARLGVSLLLAIAAVSPSLLRLHAEPLLLASLLATAAFVAIGGLAISALCRNPRPFELLLVMLAYIGVQGDGLLAVFQQPEFVVRTQLWLLPVVLVALLLCWPRLARWR